MWKIVSIFLVTIALIIAGIVDYDGDGYTLPTPQNLEIRDWYDLNAIGNNLSGSYILMNDLDSTTAGYDELASPTANGGKGWEPIGILGGIPKFTGIFDGQGHEIRDLFVNRPDQTRIGLFGMIDSDAVVKNLGVVNVTVIGGRLVGGLVGKNNGTISNSYSKGSVTGNDEVGGLVGGHSWGALHNCYSIASVAGENEVGGLVGMNDATTIDYSYCMGTISDSYSRGNVTGQSSVGGLVGATDHGIMVQDSYSDGSVTGNTHVGGLVASDEFSNVSNSYSTGNVTGDEYVGGLVGRNVGHGNVTNSFWDIETSGQATSDGGTGKTTAEMQNIGTFSGAGWDITPVANPSTRNPSYIWNIAYQVVSYPFLSWHFGCPQGHISPVQIETETVPSGYFILTVSPAEVCANIGEQIEIRCSIVSVINCIIEINSVDVLLFDSYDSMIREQAMTKDSYWSAHTVYTIVGDEAYYKLKVNFTFPGGKAEEHSEYGAHSFPILVNQNS